jgi:hypothetical protein
LRFDSDKRRIRAEHLRHGARKRHPSRGFSLQVRAAFGRERVESHAAVRVGDRPVRIDPSTIAQPSQRGVERAFLYRKRFAGDVFDPARDAVAVEVLADERFEDEDAECALEELAAFVCPGGDDTALGIVMQGVFVFLLVQRDDVTWNLDGAGCGTRSRLDCILLR